MSTPSDPKLDPRFLAGIQLLERVGAREFQIRFDEEQSPIVWVAVAMWLINPDTLRPVARKHGAVEHWECAAGLNPLRAVMRLCDQMLDGGTCTHCGKPTGVTTDFDTMPLGGYVCWYQFDPELATFRRGCE